MVLRFFLLSIFLFLSCTEGQRDNPDDRESKNYVGVSSSSVVVSRSSSSLATYTLACAAVPSTGIVSTTVIPPVVTCNGIVVGYGLDWTSAPNWNNPAIGTYSNISVMANYGECNGKTASCSGTLTVSPAPSADELTCMGMPMTGVTSTAITQPTVRCGINEITTSITWANAPAWFNPSASTYNVSATASCGGSIKTASCGTLTVASVLACGLVPPSGTTGTAITAPAVTCNGTTISNNDLDWIGAPNWSNPMAGTYSGISVSASYGECGGITATCSGKLTVGSVLACAAVPSTGIAGATIIPPTVTCNGTTVPSGVLNWTGAPNWNNPVAGTHNNISVSASSGECNGKTATCGGSLTIGAAPSADELTCTGMPVTGVTGVAVTQPTVRCGINTVNSGISWTNAPNWTNPNASTYNVSATANCGGKQQTASCGTLTIAPTYTVIYNAGTGVTGVTVPANQTKTQDIALTLSAAVPTRTGYVFAGWNTSANGSGMSYTSGASYTDNAGVTLYAQWTANTYTVTYNANDGTGAPASQTKTHDVALTLSTSVPIRAGYTFAGWNTSSNGYGTYYASGASYTANAGVTLYAQWTANTYTVTYNANNGTGAPAGQTKTHDVALTLSGSVPTRTGYDFAGWNTSNNGSGTFYASGASYTANAGVTLYAQWTAKTYTVTYNANNGTGEPASQTKSQDVALTLSSSVPTRTGYTFAGWNTSANGSGTSYTSGASYTANADITLYAQWTANTYTVTYNANDGTGAPASQTKTHDVALTLSTSVPTRAGYDFAGWNTSSNGNGTSYASGASYTTNANVTLYAKWTVTYTLTCASVPTSGTAGTAITAPTVTCTGSNSTSSTVSSGLTWTNAPTWATPVAGSYSSVSVAASSGNCSGKTASCGGTLTVQSNVVYGTPVTYEGETYNTVVIGTQTWMARNLNYNVSGSKCGNGSSLSDANTATCDTYGRLYNWATAMALPSSCNSSLCASQVGAKHQGICPSGWHIPSDAEWTTLTNYVGGASTAGTKLKSREGWNSYSGVPSGSDTYGFAALPGGYLGNMFSDVGNKGYWWSASVDYAYFAYHRNLPNFDEGVSRSSTRKSNLQSVRCLQD